MQAAVIHSLGQAPTYADHPAAAAGDGHTLVDVEAAPITPLDLLCASGTSYFGIPATPYVPGVQGVGVVRESASLPVGTRVWFTTPAGMRDGDGSMAERCRVADEDLVPLPDGVAASSVAALGLSAVAAWNALTLRGALVSGEQVLVLGAGGVVGQVAVQAARLLGAGRVVAAARSEAARARARSAGADDVVELPEEGDPHDPSAVSALAARMAAVLDGPVDLVVDPLCGLPATAAATLLGPRGRLVNLGSSAGPVAVWDSAALRSRTAAILGYTNNELTPAQRRESLLTVLAHAARGDIAVDHEPIPLSDAARAWERQQAGNATGRVVLTVD